MAIMMETKNGEKLESWKIWTVLGCMFVFAIGVYTIVESFLRWLF